MNRCIVARDLALWHAMAPSRASHGTQQGKPWHALAAPWHPPRHATAPTGVAPPKACHGTPKGRPWHATNLGFVVPTGMPRHPSTQAGHGMPWHPPKAGQVTHQGRPCGMPLTSVCGAHGHATAGHTNLGLWCPWACRGTHTGWPHGMPLTSVCSAHGHATAGTKAGLSVSHHDTLRLAMFPHWPPTNLVLISGGDRWKWGRMRRGEGRIEATQG